MMSGRELPPPEKCLDCGCVHLTSADDDEYIPCGHDCVEDVNIDDALEPLFNYTAGLKQLVTLLLRANIQNEWWASSMLDVAWRGFENWTANTEDGRLYLDLFDDIWFRQKNQARFEKQREVEDEEPMEVEEDDFFFFKAEAHLGPLGLSISIQSSGSQQNVKNLP